MEHLIRLGATRGEVVEALSMCSYMGGGPSIMYSAKALEAYDQLKN
jgi:alkylhydroperoxidase/carboxymuconolactone decarboxylase family protein YurZ